MKKLLSSTLGFWFAWGCATFAGWFIGWMISFWLYTSSNQPPAESFVVFVYALIVYVMWLIWACLAGAGQTVVLRFRRASGWFLWGLPTVLGVLGIFVIWVFNGDNFWGGAVGGLLAGTGQWLILRRNFPRAGWWIPASVLVWSLSLGLAGAYAGLTAAPRLYHWRLSEGLSFGLISGLIMSVGSANTLALLWNNNLKRALGALALANIPVAAACLYVAAVIFPYYNPLLASSYSLPQWKAQEVTISPDGRRLLTRSMRYWQVKLWDTETMQLTQTLPVDDWANVAVYFSQSSNHLFIKERDSIILWDIEQGAVAGQLPTDKDANIWDQAISPDGQFVFLLTSPTPRGYFRQDTNIKFDVQLWEPAAAGEEAVKVLDRVLVSDNHGQVFAAGRFSPDGRLLAVGIEQAMDIWDVHQATHRRQLPLQAWAGEPVFSPGGTFLAAPVGGNQINIWEVDGGALRHTLDGNVTAMAFSPDEKMLAVAGGNYRTKTWTVTNWDVATGQKLQNLPVHGDAVSRLAFSPNSQLLASSADDNIVRVWKVPGGQEKTHLTRYNSHPPLEIAFAGNDRMIVAGVQPEEVGVWVIEP
ncbi:MAG: hypothetical protein D6768_06770 [Chloroflexi bacterium]|nr:MAG: hypothetical protein D6768_06770 [Chloroflexota bacterium]